MCDEQGGGGERLGWVCWCVIAQLGVYGHFSVGGAMYCLHRCDVWWVEAHWPHFEKVDRVLVGSWYPEKRVGSVVPLERRRANTYAVTHAEGLCIPRSQRLTFFCAMEDLPRDIPFVVVLHTCGNFLPSQRLKLSTRGDVVSSHHACLTSLRPLTSPPL